MISVDNVKVYNFDGAIRGMRNPLQSYDRSDSYSDSDAFVLGSNDLTLMQKLYRAGTEHRKFARQIFVSMDITTNHTIWAELDTYKIGITRNSCSKMHTIHTQPFEKDDFTHEYIDQYPLLKVTFNSVIDLLEQVRCEYNKHGDKNLWRAMIDLLPMGYNLRATVTMNYENVFNIINQRSNHKMSEWNEFVDILRSLPYVSEIIGESSTIRFLVGDEVEVVSRKDKDGNTIRYVITKITDSGRVHGINNKGTIQNFHKDEIRKTGKHYSQILSHLITEMDG